MATYKDLLKCIRTGLSPQEIMDRLDVCPSKLRTMLAGKKLANRLAAEAQLARQIVRHQTAADVQTVAAKLREIAFGEKSETARKACLALLAEGLGCYAEENAAPAAEGLGPNADPLALMTPDAGEQEADD